MIDSSNNMADDYERTRAKEAIKISARVIGVCAAAFVVFAQAGFGPSYLIQQEKRSSGLELYLFRYFF
ncbi:MAG: hypothetical protein WBQ79_19790 [Acidobacteriaceae bacterium]